jgi:hypothetical protein
VRAKNKSVQTGLQPLFVFLFAATLSLSPAAAQTDQPADANKTKVHHTQGENEQFIPARPQSPGEYRPITPEGRLRWFARSTIGPRSLVAGLFTAGIGTAGDWPHEYGTHWAGFGQRYGIRLTGVSTSNAMESSLGAVWGEDPRYFHTVNEPFGERIKNVADLTFRAYRIDGQRHPAFARYAAIFGNNFLTNSWRAPSEADWQHALIRSGEGFGARFLSDAFSEFAPTVWRKLRHHGDHYADADGQ